MEDEVNTGLDVMTAGGYTSATGGDSGYKREAKRVEGQVKDFMTPDFPEPTEEELNLMSAQERALVEERLKGARADSKQRAEMRKRKAGIIGLRSLLSGGFGGYGLGG